MFSTVDFPVETAENRALNAIPDLVWPNEHRAEILQAVENVRFSRSLWKSVQIWRLKLHNLNEYSHLPIQCLKVDNSRN